MSGHDEARQLRAENLLLTRQVATQAAAQLQYEADVRRRIADARVEWLQAAFDLQAQRDDARRKLAAVTAVVEHARKVSQSDLMNVAVTAIEEALNG